MPTAEEALTGHVEIGSPEDWRIDWARYGGPFICLPANHGGYWVANVHGISGSAELHKRTYLIAAAPRLLVALKAMLETHGKPHREEWMNDAAYEHAKAVDANARLAIAEAEKETAVTGPRECWHQDAICPDCKGERRINGMLCTRCNGTAQIRRSELRPGEAAPFEAPFTSTLGTEK